MAYAAHLNGQLRACGATTVVSGQGTVYVNGELWAVDDDENSHTGGNLQSGHGQTVIIEGKAVIVHAPDEAKNSDGAGHTPSETRTAEGSGDVFAY